MLQEHTDNKGRSRKADMKPESIAVWDHSMKAKKSYPTQELLRVSLSE